MALIEDMFKGNLATGLVTAVGAVILGTDGHPDHWEHSSTAAKTLLKGGMVFYRETLAEIGEMATDLVAEARAELDEDARAGAAAEVNAMLKGQNATS